MTISKIFLFNCFARPERDPSIPRCRVSQFLKENPISKTCFHLADAAWRTLSGRVRTIDPHHWPILRTCLSKKSTDSLSLACAEGQVETVRRLIRKGVDVNLVEEKAGVWTPLHLACSKGYLEIVRLLLKAGADINLAEKKSGWTPLYLACALGNVEIARLLLEAGADVNLAEKERGWTPLHVACAERRTEIAKLIIEKKANIFAKSSSGQTPLNFTRDLRTLRILTGTERIRAFDACKEIHEFFDLLFPTSKGALPPNWENLLARIPKNPKLLELENEKIRLENASVQWPLADEIFDHLDAIKTPILTTEKILETLLQIHPLFAKAWELAGHPDLKEIAAEENLNIREHRKGESAFYSIDCHTITIQKGRSERGKLSGLVFETLNAIQRSSFEQVKKLDDLTREEYAFLSESFEYNSDYWRTLMIIDSKAASINYQNIWREHNIPYQEGLISHTEAVRRVWDTCYFPRWLETHPEEFKQRLAELDQAHTFSSISTAI